MFERLVAQSGHTILRRRGKYLASPYDPVKEAESFLRPYQFYCKNKETIIVLGLGCGYHVLKLMQDFPHKKILVFEPDQALVQEFKLIHPHLNPQIARTLAELNIKTINMNCVLIRNKASWVGSEEIFEQAWLKLKGPQVVSYAEAILNGSRPYKFDDRLWLCLRELVA